ncbi:MAG: M61 family metallopeptidase [Acidobacteria bacterium]|nr:M61 family metallopeptidase [Acidobacteriota bacterium]
MNRFAQTARRSTAMLVLVLLSACDPLAFARGTDPAHNSPLATATQASAPGAPLDITYRVSAPDRRAHLVDVEMRIGGVPAAARELDLELPVWAPGSYLVREFARNVQDERASTGGGPVPIVKSAKNKWRISLPGGAAGIGTRTVVVTYRVYANELSVRTSHADADHVYLNGSNVFMYVPGRKSLPVRVELDLPDDWQVATGLRPAGPAPAPAGNAQTARAFTAPDYDTLADCPIEAAPGLQILRFEALGKPHEMALWGASNVDTGRLVTDTKKIVEAAGAVFGNSLPYERYVFIVQIFPGGGGGLEHSNSTVVQTNPWGLQKKDSYRGFLELLAHEFFHAWLVKRIHPPALGPFDYTSENYTRMLWLMEGTTDYYGSLLVKRAGLMSEDDYWKDLAKQIGSLQKTPGRRHQSAEEASFDAWIKYYRPNENSSNSTVSYYLKGMILTAMLDLEIQGRTKGAKSFDDVLRQLWTTYGQRGLPVPEDGVEPAVEAAAGSDFTAFFDAYVRGRAEFDYNAFLVHAGRKLVIEAQKNDDRITPVAGAYLGARLSESDGRTLVSSIAEDSPAWAAGLSVGDDVLALDGYRVTASSMDNRLSDRAPGDEVRLTIFRRDRLIELRVKLGERPPENYRIEKIGAASDGGKVSADRGNP